MSNPYQTLLLDHFRQPRHAGTWDPEQPAVVVDNPLCGDRIAMQLPAGEKDLAHLAYEVKGCAVLTASASMLTSLVCHRPVRDASRVTEALLHYFEHKPDHWDHEMGDELEALCELRKTPMRIKCVTLPWQALHRLLVQHFSGQAGT